MGRWGKIGDEAALSAAGTEVCKNIDKYNVYTITAEVFLFYFLDHV